MPSSFSTRRLEFYAFVTPVPRLGLLTNRSALFARVAFTTCSFKFRVVGSLTPPSHPHSWPLLLPNRVYTQSSESLYTVVRCNEKTTNFLSGNSIFTFFWAFVFFFFAILNHRHHRYTRKQLGLRRIFC